MALFKSTSDQSYGRLHNTSFKKNWENFFYSMFFFTIVSSYGIYFSRDGSSTTDDLYREKKFL